MEVEDQEEVIIMVVKELKKSLARSIQSSKWSMENGLLYYRGKVCQGTSFKTHPYHEV